MPDDLPHQLTIELKGGPADGTILALIMPAHTLAVPGLLMVILDGKSHVYEADYLTDDKTYLASHYRQEMTRPLQESPK